MRRWWHTRTLRFRLGLWYAVVGTLLIAGFSATLYSFVESRMAVPLDHQLRRDLLEVERRLRVASDGTIRWNDQEIGERATWTTQYPWFELWDENGHLVRRCWPFTENRVQEAPSAPARGRETFSVFSVAPDLRLRVLSLPYEVPGRESRWMLRIMRLHEQAGDALGALRAIILVALPVVVALLCAGGYWLTRKWLSPLERMIAEAHAIRPEDLSRRLTVHNPVDELGRLSRVFNVTLDRLEHAFRALDRFVADASHELRTPLNALMNVGEIGLRRVRTPAEYQEIIGSMLEEARRLQVLMRRLLELAAVEGGAGEIRRENVALDRSIQAWVADVMILAEQKSQPLSVAARDLVVRTDPVLLRQALQNLLENAIKYSPEGAPIHVEVDANDLSVIISVRDEGSGIRPEHRAQITGRFFRPDRGRDRTSGGFGLGLAITKAYMRKLGGALVFEPNQPRGSIFRLVLPRVAGEPAERMADVEQPEAPAAGSREVGH